MEKAPEKPVMTSERPQTLTTTNGELKSKTSKKRHWFLRFILSLLLPMIFILDYWIYIYEFFAHHVPRFVSFSANLVTIFTGLVPIVFKDAPTVDITRIVPPLYKHDAAITTPVLRIASISSLISQLDGYRDAYRYDRLELGIKGLPETVKIEPHDALALLGPLTGSFRFTALSRYLLPRLRIPVSSNEFSILLNDFRPEDRWDILQMLAGCFKQPVNMDALLIGIDINDRDSVESKLDSGKPCNLAQATRK